MGRLAKLQRELHIFLQNLIKSDVLFAKSQKFIPAELKKDHLFEIAEEKGVFMMEWSRTFRR